ncbi:MAG: tandem-95 repeat protein, partial [Clostridia bacterium]|nr:tandem-95 repeat protein [Clostridia bacterium]
VGKTFAWWLYGNSYDGDIARYELVSDSGEGKFDLSENGRFTYTAPSYSYGTQSFSFVVYNKDGIASLPVTVNITVTASKAPVACSNTFTTGVHEQIIEQLDIRDFDGSIANTVITVQPSHGELTVSSDGKFSYKPEKGFSGIDRFEYHAIDNMGDKSNTGYISIAVGKIDLPIACNHTIITESNETVTTEFLAITSDSDIPHATNDASIAYALSVLPTYGTVDFVSENSVEYTPYDDFSGEDSFKFIIVYPDGTQSNDAIVTVATIPRQRPSVVSLKYVCIRNLSCSGVVQSEDVDGKVVSYRVTAEPEKGKLIFDEETGKFTYRPPFGFDGEITFSYIAIDNDGLESREGTVKIEVGGIIAGLKASGKLLPVCAALIALLVAITVVVVLVVTNKVRKRREAALEAERERLRALIARSRRR